MDKRFLAWIIKQHEKLEGKNKHCFLQGLKFQPEGVLRFIKENLENWAMVAVATLGIPISIYGHDLLAKEVLEAFQQHFATDMAVITQ